MGDGADGRVQNSLLGREERLRFGLDEVLEAPLVDGEQVVFREPSLVNIEREIVGLVCTSQEVVIHDRRVLTQDDAIQEVCSGVCAYSQSYESIRLKSATWIINSRKCSQTE